MSENLAAPVEKASGIVRAATNYRTSEQVQELFSALSAAQKVMAGATKDATNPHFGNRYADLASVWDACRAPLADNGLSVFQPVTAEGSRVTVTTLLAHKSGQWISSDLTLTSDKATAQGVGSAITYGRRYGLSAMVGIAPEDDDGNLASGRQGSKEAQQEVAQRKLAGKPKGDRSNPEQYEPESGRHHIDAGQAAPGATDFKMLSEFKAMKAALGDVIYYACLKAFGYHKSNQIESAAKGREVYRSMGTVKKVVDAAKHGEVLPGMNEAVFENLPAESLAAVFSLIEAKIVEACGTDVAAEEIADARKATKGQSKWALYQNLEKRLAGLLEVQIA